MIEQYVMQMPKQVYCGVGSLTKISTLIPGYSKAAVFTDRGVLNAGLLEEPLKQLQNAGVDHVIIDSLMPEPTWQQVQNTVDTFNAACADFIIAVGGGSVMDAAKLVSVLAGGNITVKDLLDKTNIVSKQIPTLMIPTTSGTGAEATPNAIVAIPEKEVKQGIVNPQMIADYVILDPVMTEKLPSAIASSTGVDALCHAIECWTGNKANPFSDLFAGKALDLIMNNIEAACLDPDAVNSRINMQLASFYAGVAITSSGTTAVHALSYPIGGKYHVPHGVANAVLLNPVMKFNESACRQRLADAYDLCHHENHSELSTAEKSAEMLKWLEAVVHALPIPKNYQAYGISVNDLDILVQAGMEQQRLLSNNMRKVTSEDAEAIYRQVI